MSAPFSYLNTSGLAVPPYGVMQVFGPPSVSAIGLFSHQTTAPADLAHLSFVIDTGGGAAASGAGSYGQCRYPDDSPFWVNFGGSFPLREWVTEVGPVVDSFSMDTSGSGYVYAGQFDPANNRILVISLGRRVRLQGLLNGDLSKPTDIWNGPTTGLLEVYMPLSPGQFDPVSGANLFADTTQEVSFVNRDPCSSGTSGTYGKIEFINGEWELYYLGCRAGSGAGSGSGKGSGGKSGSGSGSGSGHASGVGCCTGPICIRFPGLTSSIAGGCGSLPGYTCDWTPGTSAANVTCVQAGGNSCHLAGSVALTPTEGIGCSVNAITGGVEQLIVTIGCCSGVMSATYVSSDTSCSGTFTFVSAGFTPGGVTVTWPATIPYISGRCT